MITERSRFTFDMVRPPSRHRKRGRRKVGPLLTPRACGGMLSKGTIGTTFAPVTDKASVSSCQGQDRGLVLFRYRLVSPANATASRLWPKWVGHDLGFLRGCR